MKNMIKTRPSVMNVKPSLLFDTVVMSKFSTIIPVMLAKITNTIISVLTIMSTPVCKLKTPQQLLRLVFYAALISLTALLRSSASLSLLVDMRFLRYYWIKFSSNCCLLSTSINMARKGVSKRFLYYSNTKTFSH